MRDGGPLVLSITAHGVVFAAAAVWVVHRGVHAAVAPTVLVEATPSEVSFVVAPVAPAAAAAAAPTPAPAAATVETAPAPRRRSAPTPARATAIPAAAPRADALAMRRGSADLTLPRWFDPGAGTPAPPPSGALQPAGENRVIRDDVVDITVAPDGSAKVAKTPLARAQLVRPTLKGFGRLLDEWYRNPDKQRRRGPWEERALEWRAKDPSIEHHQDVAPGRRTSVGRMLADVASNLFIPRVVGSTDLTDIALRAAGARDPYELRKLAALDATRDERAARGARHREAEQGRAGQIMRKNLQALWARPLTAAERRLALFVMWDECAEGEGALGESGELARRTVRGWIAGHLPEGSPEGYGAEELDALNARRVSKQRFDPYGRTLSP